LADHLGGQVDSLDGLPAVRLPVDAYLVMLTSKMAGVMAPADRQYAARWVRGVKSRTKVALSPYLQEMAAYPEEAGTDVLIALDLADVVSQSRVREKLSQMGTLKGKNVDLDQLSQLLAGLRGVSLAIQLKERAVGGFRVDFSQDASALADFAKPLILEVLAARGATIDELEQWKAEVTGNTVYLYGDMTVSGLRRVLSLIEPPLPPLQKRPATPPPPTIPAPTPPAPSPPKPVAPAPVAPAPAPAAPDKGHGDTYTVAEASLKHFNAVKSLLDDVRNPRSGTIKTTGQYAIWLDRYARKIDELPIMNVDSDLLDFSAQVAAALRSLGGNFRGVGITAGTRSADSTVVGVGPYHSGSHWGGNRWGYGGGSWGGYSAYRAGLSERSIARKRGTAAAAATKSNLTQEISKATQQMRRLLTERYQIEF
jgi:hypothetical protein